MLERFLRKLGKKEVVKKYVPAVTDLHQILSTNLDKLHDDILFWTGSENNPEAKFKASIHGKGVDVELEAGGQTSYVFEIGVGDDKGLFFKNRALLPGFEVFKLKPYTEMHNREDLVETVMSFVTQKPKPEEIKDIRLETLKKRMLDSQVAPADKIPFSVGRAPKREIKK